MKHFKHITIALVMLLAVSCASISENAPETINPVKKKTTKVFLVEISYDNGRKKVYTEQMSVYKNGGIQSFSGLKRSNKVEPYSISQIYLRGNFDTLGVFSLTFCTGYMKFTEDDDIAVALNHQCKYKIEDHEFVLRYDKSRTRIRHKNLPGYLDLRIIDSEEAELVSRTPEKDVQ